VAISRTYFDSSALPSFLCPPLLIRPLIHANTASPRHCSRSLSLWGQLLLPTPSLPCGVRRAGTDKRPPTVLAPPGTMHFNVCSHRSPPAPLPKVSRVAHRVETSAWPLRRWVGFEVGEEGGCNDEGDEKEGDDRRECRRWHTISSDGLAATVTAAPYAKLLFGVVQRQTLMRSFKV
jgi:hypothetical protein